MRRSTLERASDADFLREIGVKPDWTPGLGRARQVALAAVVFLALSTTLFAAMFRMASVARGDTFQVGVTQCPMTKPPAPPPTTR